MPTNDETQQAIADWYIQDAASTVNVEITITECALTSQGYEEGYY